MTFGGAVHTKKVNSPCVRPNVSLWICGDSWEPCSGRQRKTRVFAPKVQFAKPSFNLSRRHPKMLSVHWELHKINCQDSSSFADRYTAETTSLWCFRFSRSFVGCLCTREFSWTCLTEIVRVSSWYLHFGWIQVDLRPCVRTIVCLFFTGTCRLFQESCCAKRELVSCKIVHKAPMWEDKYWQKLLSAAAFVFYLCKYICTLLSTISCQDKAGTLPKIKNKKNKTDSIVSIDACVMVLKTIKLCEINW